MQNFKTLMACLRPNFLLLTFSVIVFSAALAISDGGHWSGPLFTLVLVVALVAHASVNLFNEYEDWLSGLDDLTQRTPFSGGSGGLQFNPAAAELVLATAYGTLGFLLMTGGFLIWLKGWLLLPFGLIGLALIFFYTRWLTRSPWLCFIAPGLAFGPLMVIGSYYVFMSEVTLTVVMAAFIPFFLVNNLLLLNQYPDLKADRLVGRYNLIMLLGNVSAMRVFQGGLWIPFLLLAGLLAFDGLPIGAALGGLGLLFAIPLSYGVFKQRNAENSSHRLLALNVMINLWMPFLIAIGLLSEQFNWLL